MSPDTYTGPESTELRVTADGSHTLYVPSLNEHYHSHHGAVTESRHIFINAGLASLRSQRISIIEIGFGTGLNALLTAVYAEENKISISYTTIEKYPLSPSLISALNYGTIAGHAGHDLFKVIHDAVWNVPVQLSEWFTLEKKQDDLTQMVPEGSFDLVYFDAFGPDKQPEMWSREVLHKIAAVTHSGSVFVTYSAMGELKRILRDLGFEVAHLPGPPGKRMITRAVKK